MIFARTFLFFSLLPCLQNFSFSVLSSSFVFFWLLPNLNPTKEIERERERELSPPFVFTIPLPLSSSPSSLFIYLFFTFAKSKSYERNRGREREREAFFVLSSFKSAFKKKKLRLKSSWVTKVEGERERKIKVPK
jgi:hypothetical protein